MSAPEPVELVGLAEIAGMLRISRTRAGELSHRADFPAPLAVLRAGRIYSRRQVEAWIEVWPRKNGRPAKPCRCQSPGEMIT